MKEDSFYEEVIIAGFGGQGVILAGKLLAQAAMSCGKEVTYMPSYGAEMRGGTANSMVVISDEPVASPLVSNPSSLIVMNKASALKFAPRLKANGLIIYNSSLIDDRPATNGSAEIIAIPADALAVELGNKKTANMIMLGAYLQKKGCISLDAAGKALSVVLAKRYHNTLDLNIEALHRGADFIKDRSG